MGFRQTLQRRPRPRANRIGNPADNLVGDPPFTLPFKYLRPSVVESTRIRTRLARRQR